jgi:hypothetical protein
VLSCQQFKALLEKLESSLHLLAMQINSHDPLPWFLFIYVEVDVDVDIENSVQTFFLPS